MRRSAFAGASGKISRIEWAIDLRKWEASRRNSTTQSAVSNTLAECSGESEFNCIESDARSNKRKFEAIALPEIP